MSVHTKFIEEYGSDYGYDGKIDAIRKEEFGRVEGILKITVWMLIIVVRNNFLFLNWLQDN